MIKIGDTIAPCTLKTMGETGPVEFDTAIEFKSKKVVLFAVPGAFTPTCSASHLPGYIEHYAAFMQLGVDLIVCISVNDAFVMHAWGESAQAKNIVMLGDGNADFTRAVGLDKDASAHQMGIRSKRYAMIIEDGVLSYLTIDEKGLDSTAA